MLVAIKNLFLTIGKNENKTQTYVVTAIALNFRCPSEMALHKAVRSAHIVNPYEAFSTLHPMKNKFWKGLLLLLLLSCLFVYQYKACRQRWVENNQLGIYYTASRRSSWPRWPSQLASSIVGRLPFDLQFDNNNNSRTDTATHSLSRFSFFRTRTEKKYLDRSRWLRRRLRWCVFLMSQK